MDGAWEINIRVNLQSFFPDFFGEGATQQEVIECLFFFFAERAARGAFHSLFLQIFASKNASMGQGPAEKINFWDEGP